MTYQDFVELLKGYCENNVAVNKDSFKNTLEQLEKNRIINYNKLGYAENLDNDKTGRYFLDYYDNIDAKILNMTDTQFKTNTVLLNVCDDEVTVLAITKYMYSPEAISYNHTAIENIILKKIKEK